MTRRLIVSAVIVALLAAPALAWNEPDSFEGVPWGASQAEAKRVAAGRSEPLRSCFEAAPYQICTAAGTIGSVGSRILFLFRDDKLVSGQWSFPSTSFDSVRSLFVERYGAPSTQKDEPLQTVDALRATNPILRWDGTSVVIELRAHAGGKFNEGLASISTKPEADRPEAERARAIQKGRESR